MEGQLGRQNSPEDDFLHGSNLEPGTVTGGCEFDSDCPRPVAGLVEDHPCDSGGGNNRKVRTLEHLRGEIGVLCGNSTSLRVHKID